MERASRWRRARWRCCASSPRSIHGPLLERAAHERDLQHVEVRYEANRDHHLSPDEGERVAAIDRDVVERLVSWLTEAVSTN